MKQCITLRFLYIKNLDSLLHFENIFYITYIAELLFTADMVVYSWLEGSAFSTIVYRYM
jgi:hypothetical protein